MTARVRRPDLTPDERRNAARAKAAQAWTSDTDPLAVRALTGIRICLSRRRAALDMA